jgi:hypothetical protein
MRNSDLGPEHPNWCFYVPLSGNPITVKEQRRHVRVPGVLYTVCGISLFLLILPMISHFFYCTMIHQLIPDSPFNSYLTFECMITLLQTRLSTKHEERRGGGRWKYNIECSRKQSRTTSCASSYHCPLPVQCASSVSELICPLYQFQ